MYLHCTVCFNSAFFILTTWIESLQAAMHFHLTLADSIWSIHVHRVVTVNRFHCIDMHFALLIWYMCVYMYMYVFKPIALL